jgi:hypothetical protein
MVHARSATIPQRTGEGSGSGSAAARSLRAPTAARRAAGACPGSLPEGLLERAPPPLCHLSRRYQLHVEDTDPTSLSAGGWLEDVSKVDKYVMSDGDYAQRENTYRRVRSSASGARADRAGPEAGGGQAQAATAGSIGALAALRRAPPRRWDAGSTRRAG